MRQRLRVDTAGVQAMATRWDVWAGELGDAAAPTGPALSGRASATAVNAAHADITAFTMALATQVGIRAAGVTAADASYTANEGASANELATVARPATGGH